MVLGTAALIFAQKWTVAVFRHFYFTECCLYR